MYMLTLTLFIFVLPAAFFALFVFSYIRYKVNCKPIQWKNNNNNNKCVNNRRGETHSHKQYNVIKLIFAVVVVVAVIYSIKSEFERLIT